MSCAIADSDISSGLMFWIDLDKKTLDTADKNLSARELGYIKRFIAGLSADGWDLLRKDFALQKAAFSASSRNFMKSCGTGTGG